MEETYTQCVLVRRTQAGFRQVSVAWIPTKFAIVDKVLKLKMLIEEINGGWQDGWIVSKIWGTRDSTWVIEHNEDDRKLYKHLGMKEVRE